jgi:hypothetical protein
MKSILSFLKSNALMIALLGVVGYQQTMLTELMEMHHINNEHIVDIYNKLNGVEIDVEGIPRQLDQMEIELMMVKRSVDALQYQ